MELVSEVATMERRARELSRKGRLSLVPTMGALHEGHLSLVRLAASRSDATVVSVFVNPTQFGPGEDFERYPRDLERDAELAKAAGADILFAPSAEEMYPEGFSTVVHVKDLTDRLCGSYRPGHFDGVTTVVAKLFGIVRPDLAVFGQKDGQQVAVIERMAADLNLGVEIVRGAIVREDDGVALSSRNRYLSDEERARARVLSAALAAARDRYEGGERSAEAVVSEVRRTIEKEPAVRLQYVEAVDAKTLVPVRTLNDGVMVTAAVYVGDTRLIDNVILGEAAEIG
ncbi:MAG: pantoate--beta-alanine ligase [Candidatus Eisenbacteria bacterium]|nr:pantoate--beta-alanine ligase [Candidatus Eisenbacteria bacterium]